MEHLSDSVCKAVLSVVTSISSEELSSLGGSKTCKSNELLDLNRVNTFFLNLP